MPELMIDIGRECHSPSFYFQPPPHTSYRHRNWHHLHVCRSSGKRGNGRRA